MEAAIDDLQEHLSRSDEIYIKHYHDKYQEDFPPVWVACEIMSFGLTSRFYSNLRNYKVRRLISAAYQFDEGFLEGLLEHLTYVRNICAHHSRLWNRHFTKKMPLPKTKPSGLSENIYIDENNKTEHKLYNTTVLLQHLIQIISPNSDWAKRLEALINKHAIDIKRMGFPINWKTLPLWKSALEN